MNQFHCKYCSSPMHVSFLEYRSNSYCNNCFDDRSGKSSKVDSCLGTFEFMGHVFPLSNPNDDQSMTLEKSKKDYLKSSK